jgi:hypothetical protein
MKLDIFSTYFWIENFGVSMLHRPSAQGGSKQTKIN